MNNQVFTHSFLLLSLPFDLPFSFFLSPLHSFPPSFYLSLLPFFLPSPHSFIHVLVSGHTPGTELGTLQASWYFFLTSLCCRDGYCSFLGDGKIEGQKNYEVFLKQLVRSLLPPHHVDPQWPGGHECISHQGVSAPTPDTDTWDWMTCCLYHRLFNSISGLHPMRY